MIPSPVTKHVVDDRERTSAKAVADALAHLISRGGQVKLVVEPRGEQSHSVAVGTRLAEAFLDLSSLIQSAGEVSMFADDPELSPEAASEVLGMLRPMVVQRIASGDLKARTVGADHRIKMSELLAFRAREAERKAALAEFGDLTDQLATKHGG